MKIRYIAVIYTIIILITLAGGYYKYKTDDTVYRDMITYNEQLILIERGMEQGTSVLEMQERYKCHIIQQKDSNYESLLNDRIKEGDVVLDLLSKGQYIGKVAWNTEYVAYQDLKKQLFISYMMYGVILITAGYFGMVLLYYYVIRPFQKLQTFTQEIAKGNLDLPLPMERNNFFGAFTESFDIMREELKRAKENEYEANRSKKELVLELSHDIKTPLATIRATCEVMQIKEMNMDMLEKVNIIARKSEMIDKLISNLFHATMEELEVLKVDVTEENSRCIKNMFEELKFYGEIKFENEVPELLVYMDKLRLQQVIDNIVNNSYKYAGTPITVTFLEIEEGIKILIRDSGQGVPQDDLVLVAEKYYRGSNTKGKAGSGLGLYLAQMFLKKMQGGMECYNEKGFVVVIFLKKV